MQTVTGPSADPPRASRGMRDYLSSGWQLGGAALRFVLRDRTLQRFVLRATGVVLVIAAGVAVAAVALRREAGPVEYVLVGLAAYYCLSLMVTAVAVGVAGLVADSLDSRPVTPATGWHVIRRRRRSIAGWAVLDLLLGVPSRLVGSWTVEQLAVLALGFGWALLSFFAIPTIALTGGSAWSVARRSARLVRGHWGDAIYSTVYLWVRAVVLLGLPAAALVAVGVLLLRNDAEILGGALFASGVTGLALAFLATHVARAVLTVVLYRYADSGTVYPDFPAELLQRSVRGPSAVVRRLAQRIEGDRIRRLRRRVLGDLDDAPVERP
jgi:hypothetical protein